MAGYEHRPLAGIGGWLTFFLLVIGVFTPLRVVIESIAFFGDPAIHDYFGKNWSAVAAWQALVSVLQLGGFGFMAWRMLKVHIWQSVRLTIAGLWILQLGLTAVDLIVTPLLAGMSTGEVFASAGLAPIQAVVFAAIWTAYLLRSERVANTYPRDGDSDEVAEVFT